MPDSLIINESPAHPPVSTVGTVPATKGLKDVFSPEPTRSAPSLDVVAIHTAADREVDEIYRLLSKLSNAVSLLDFLVDHSLTDHGQAMMFSTVAGILAEATDVLLTANDRLCTAIDPLKPVQVA